MTVGELARFLAIQDPTMLICIDDDDDGVRGALCPAADAVDEKYNHEPTPGSQYNCLVFRPTSWPL
jgi:hypothetical protein